MSASTHAVLTASVVEVVAATPRTRLVRLHLNGRTFGYRAGQAVRVRPHGGGPASVYSIAAAPADVSTTGHLELLVRFDPTRPSVPVFELSTGTLVDVEGPLGALSLPLEIVATERLVFIAGGSGIAPIRAMVREALATTSRPITLFYSARTDDEFAFAEELTTLAAGGHIVLVRTVTRAGSVEIPERRRISVADLAPYADQSTRFIVCGPLELVTATTAALTTLGVPPAHIHTDRW